MGSCLRISRKSSTSSRSGWSSVLARMGRCGPIRARLTPCEPAGRRRGPADGGSRPALQPARSAQDGGRAAPDVLTVTLSWTDLEARVAGNQWRPSCAIGAADRTAHLSAACGANFCLAVDVQAELVEDGRVVERPSFSEHLLPGRRRRGTWRNARHPLRDAPAGGARHAAVHRRLSLTTHPRLLSTWSSAERVCRDPRDPFRPPSVGRSPNDARMAA
jgi:hypothetical protein